MIRVKQNRSQVSMSTLIEQAKDEVEEEVKEEIINIAEVLVLASPVDTGAYVTSHSYVPKGSGGGRRRSSRNKPRRQNQQAKRAEAMRQLRKDINAVNTLESGGGVFRNRSPHAPRVEYTGWPGKEKSTPAYKPYTRTSAKFK